ncbi:uncharacterized protein AAEQ78_021533 isoform 1-T1 [Lycaon pictus]
MCISLLFKQHWNKRTKRNPKETPPAPCQLHQDRSSGSEKVKMGCARVLAAWQGCRRAWIPAWIPAAGRASFQTCRSRFASRPRSISVSCTETVDIPVRIKTQMTKVVNGDRR